MNPSIDPSFSMLNDFLEMLIPSFNDRVLPICLRLHHSFKHQLVPSLILIVSRHDRIF